MQLSIRTTQTDTHTPVNQKEKNTVVRFCIRVSGAEYIIVIYAMY